MSIVPYSPRRVSVAAAKIVTLALALLAHVVQAEVPRLTPGAWQIEWNMVSVTGARGIPPEVLDLQAVNAERCLDRVPVLPLPPGEDRACRIDLESAVSDAVQWRGVCANGASSVDGRVRYRGERLEGSFTLRRDGLTMLFEVLGKRRGACR